MKINHPDFKFKIWPAITPNNIRESKFKSYLNDYTFSTMREGAIGCALSHITLLEHFLRSPDSEIIVFEDDVELSQNIEKDYIDFRNNLPSNYDVCQFLHHKNEKSFRHLDDYKMRNPFVMKYYAPIGSVGNLISRKGANKILKNCKPIKIPIDNFIQNLIRDRKLISYMPIKDLIYMPYSLPSNIWTTRIEGNITLDGIISRLHAFFLFFKL